MGILKIKAFITLEKVKLNAIKMVATVFLV
jgi:hypothetical protein